MSLLKKSRLPKTQKPFIDKDLIHVENPPIKKILIDRYQDYLNQIHQLKAKIELFEIQEEPAYETWMKNHFSKVVDQIQKAKNSLSELQNRLSEAEFIALRYGISLHEAYKRVLEKANELLEKEKRDESNEDPDSVKNHCDEDGRLKSSTKVFNNQNKSIKEIYRYLARKLHPDMRSFDHPIWDDLWLEAQVAYQTSNIGDLNRLALILEAHETVHSDHPHLSIILKVNLVFEKQIHELQDQIKTLEQNPAWEFSKNQTPKLIKVLLAKTKQKLQSELSEVLSELNHHQQMEKDYAPQQTIESKTTQKKPSSRTKISSPKRFQRKSPKKQDFFSS